MLYLRTQTRLLLCRAGPESPPQNITVSAVMTGYLTPPDSMGSNGGSSGGASILVNWQGVAALGAHGLYHLYISPADEFGAQRTREWSQHRSPRRQWSEHEVPGGQNSTVLHNLRTSQPYLLVMSAQNRFGRSPLSSLCFFRTADGKLSDIPLPPPHELPELLYEAMVERCGYSLGTVID